MVYTRKSKRTANNDMESEDFQLKQNNLSLSVQEVMQCITTRLNKMDGRIDNVECRMDEIENQNETECQTDETECRVNIVELLEILDRIESKIDEILAFLKSQKKPFKNNSKKS